MVSDKSVAPILSLPARGSEAFDTLASSSSSNSCTVGTLNVEVNGSVQMSPFNLRKHLGRRSKSIDQTEGLNNDGPDILTGVRRASDSNQIPGAGSIGSGLATLAERPAEPSPTPSRHNTDNSATTGTASIMPSRLRRGKSPPIQDPLGLHLLYRPTGAANADIVFIHGLGGTSHMTWSKNKNKNLFWPLEFLPLEQDICQARIFTYGYMASVMKTSSRGSTSVLDFAKNLLYDLKFAMEDDARLNIGTLPIIFVAHSMGGLIVKEAYIQGSADPTYQEMVKAVSAIVFLSTPHRGSDFADILNRILQVSLVSAPKEYINNLSRNSAALQRINETFRHLVSGLNIVSFYETQTTPIGFEGNRIMVVDRDSSILGYPGEVSKGLDADHHTVCKYDSRNDPSYLTVRNYIRMQLTKVFPIPKTRSKASSVSISLADIRELEKACAISEPPDSDYISFRDRWTDGTCDWILSNSPFRRWVDDQDKAPRLLWLQGGAGCGKSVMASFIINHLVENQKSCQYAFVRFGDQQKRSLSMMFRLLAFQIALVWPAFHHEIGKILNSLKRKAEPLTIWQRVFKTILFQMDFPTPLYWVIDGMDESENSRVGIKILSEALSIRAPLRIIILSRKVPEMDAEFRKIPIDAKWDIVSFDGHSEDFLFFIEKELEWTEIPSFREQIIAQLLDKSQGNFLWLRLTVDRINRCRTTESVILALQELPTGMEELYDRMGSSILEQEPVDRFLTIRILAWVTCALRPLTVDELTEALEIQSQARSINDSCAGFVTIDSYANVALIHQTASDYLLNCQDKKYFIDKRVSHENIFLRSLKSLMSRTLRRDVTKETTSPFLKYIITHWSIHLISSSSTSDEAIAALVRFLRSPNVLIWIHAVVKARYINILVQTSSNLAAFAQKIGVSDAKSLPLERHRDEQEFIEAWATDLAKITGKFGSQLMHMPDSIYKIIPPFCPPESVIYRQFGRKEIDTLKISGLSNTAWDDSLGCLSLRQNEKATALVAEGQWIAVSANLANLSTVILYHSATFQEVRRLDIGERMRRMQINSLGTLLVSCGLRTTKVWNLATGVCVTEAKNPPALPHPMSVAFSKNDASVLIATNDRRVWSMSLSSQKSTMEAITRVVQKSSTGRSVNSPTCMALSPDGRQLALSYRLGATAIWDVELAEQACQSKDLSTALEIVWHPFDGEIYGRQEAGFIFKWHPDEDELKLLRASASTLAISSDGNILAAGDHRGGFKLINTADLTIIHQGIAQDPIVCLCISQDNQQVYDIRGRYGNIWQPTALLKLSEPPSQLSDGGSETEKTSMLSAPEEIRYGKVDPITALAPLASGTWFCSGSEAGTMSIHQLERGLLCELEPTGFGIEQIAWSADGNYVCLGDLGRTILIFKIQEVNGLAIQTDMILKMSIKQFEDSITQVLFDVKSKWVLVSTRTFTVIVSIEEQRIINSLDLNSLGPGNCKGRWMLHPKRDELIIFLSAWTMTIFSWSSLSKVISIPVATPVHEYLTNGSLFQTIPNDEMDQQDHEKREMSSSELDAHLSIERLLLTKSLKYILVEALTLIDGQKRTLVSLLDIRDLPTFHEGQPTDSNFQPGQIHSVELLSSVMGRMSRPLNFLMGRGGTSDILVFLDCHSWVCSWDISTKVASAIATVNRETGHQSHRDGDTAEVVGEPYSAFTTTERWVIVAIVSSASWCSNLSAFVYLPALKPLADAFDVSISRINLTLTVYNAVATVAPTLVGDAADVWGRRPAYLFTLTVFAVANACLARATSYGELLSLRVLQTLGQSSIILIGYGIMADIASPAERGTFISAVSFAVTVGPSIGPVLGGALSYAVGWPWIFWFLVIVSGTCLVLIILILPETSRGIVGNGSVRPAQHLRLPTLIVGKFMQPWTRDAVARNSTLPGPRRLPNPLVSMRLLLRKDNTVVLLAWGLMYAVYAVLITTLSTLFIAIYDLTEWQAGIIYLPFAIGGTVATFFSGALLNKAYRKARKKRGLSTDKLKGDDLDGFPIEKARINVMWAPMSTIALLNIGYGWLLQFKMVFCSFVYTSFCYL
ncbi:hypothetical protein BX600DRAFT_515806 [Xylariales sp. PMI_506]|nr:hypothetical protein BX600DRAFT_515806 [Xylariales sp. PMI_506]